MLPKLYLEHIKQNTYKPHDFAAFDCHNVRLLDVVSSDSGKQFRLPVSCGKCVRCQDKLRNEWATRMCLHSLDYKWCYYVTLTYGNYDLTPYKKHPFRYKWLETGPVLDSFNYKHIPAWTPSILVHQHLTDFLKRLRKNASSELSYCACGEYGSSAHGHGYGRPHFHLIVWSNDLLFKSDFSDAWSFDCAKTSDPYVVERWTGKQDPDQRFRFYIGNVEFENLTHSGAMDWDGIHTDISAFNNSHDCFTYVAKYVGKRESIPLYAKKRVRALYDRFPFSDVYSDEDYSDCFDTPSTTPSVTGYQRDQIYKKININNRDYAKLSYEDFETIVSPFFVSSRTYCIGKGYLLANLERFQRGSYKLPKWQGKNLAFPAYYSRMVAQSQYPIRLRSCTLFSRSFTKGSLPTLFQFFSELRCSRDYYFFAKSVYAPPTSSISRKRISGDFTRSIKYSCNGCELIDVSLVLPDEGNISYIYFPHTDLFIGYKYNRHTREYDPKDQMTREDFCDYILTIINARWDKLPAIIDNLDKQLELHSLIKSDPLSAECLEQYIAYRSELSSKHKNKQKLQTDFQ